MQKHMMRTGQEILVDASWISEEQPRLNTFYFFDTQKSVLNELSLMVADSRCL